MKHYLFYDTETSGFPSDKIAPDDPKQAWICQFAAKLINEQGDTLMTVNVLQHTKGREIGKYALAVHGKTPEMCNTEGIRDNELYNLLLTLFKLTDISICHNVAFDKKLLTKFAQCFDDTELYDCIQSTPSFCTMKETTEMCKLKKAKGYGYKWPKLEELHQLLYGCDFDNAHDALADVNATVKCFMHAKVQEIFHKR